MSEHERMYVGWLDLFIIVVFVLAFVTALGVSHQSEIRDLQRRVGQLESEKR